MDEDILKCTLLVSGRTAFSKSSWEVAWKGIVIMVYYVLTIIIYQLIMMVDNNGTAGCPFFVIISITHLFIINNH